MAVLTVRTDGTVTDGTGKFKPLTAEWLREMADAERKRNARKRNRKHASTSTTASKQATTTRKRERREVHVVKGKTLAPRTIMTTDEIVKQAAERGSLGKEAQGE